MGTILEKVATVTDFEQLKGLIDDFSMNIVDIATSNNRENEEAFKQLLKSELSDKRQIKDGNGAHIKRVRNVLVIGSGASKDVHNKIYTAANLLDQIAIENPQLKETIDKELESLKKIDRADITSFEIKMKALSKVMEETSLRKELKSLLGYKYHTSLFYEIVGHMFKHRLIDVIINYNFDEMLDNIIEDEMGSSEYFKILFNGHCPDDYGDLHIEKKLAIPVYVKPHGTISHLGSLKFTNEEYSKGNKGQIKELLVNILSQDSLDDEVEVDLPVNIIFVGYSFNDFDFSEIMKEAFQLFENRKLSKEINKYSLYVFDILELEDFRKKEHSLYFEELIASIKSTNHYIQLNQTNNEWQIGNIFKNLYNGTIENFKEEINAKFPKNIARHELIAKIFHRPMQGNLIKMINKNQKGFHDNRIFLKEYLEKRILVELALIIMSSDGILHINQINQSRVKKYCTIYFDKCVEVGKYKSLKDFLKVFKGLEEYMKVIKDTYILKEAYKKNNEINFDKIYFDLNRIIKISSDDKEDNERNEYINLFKNVTINSKMSIVNPDLKEYYVSAFEGLERKDLLYSDIRWLFKFKNLFQKNQDWNVLLCISENGEVFNDVPYINELKRRKALVWMILPDYRKDRKKEFNRSYKEKYDKILLEDNKNIINPEINRMPWELHNKHMYIFLNYTKTSEEPIPVAGFYYTRRLLSNIVNPIYFEDDVNINILIDFFCNYWHNANQYNNRHSNLKSNKDDFEFNRIEIINELYQNCLKMNTLND